MSGWQPIETAPKDGAWVLVIEGQVPDKPQFVAKWNDYGWVDCDDDVNYTINPTHWMPLPEPPISVSGEPSEAKDER